jgi:hypothetical protein
MMSIRLRPDGLSFSAYSPGEGQSFFFRDVTFDGNAPYTSSLKELFFTNECLTWTYKKTNILSVSGQYTLLPDSVFEEKMRSAVLAFNFSYPEKRCLVNHLEEEKARLIFGVNEEIYEFCARSTTNPLFTHHITSCLTILRKETYGASPSRMYVIVHRRMVDIICFEGERLVFVNSFDFDNMGDLTYYILYAWVETGMNQLEDAMLLSGDAGMCTRLTASLATYIRHIGRMGIPSAAYLLSGEILQAPSDLILMMLCE